MTDIPNQVAKQTEASSFLPQAVAEMTQIEEAPEINPYLISFTKYNDKMCEISELNSNKAKRAIETLKTIGTKIRSTTDYQRHKVDRISIRREGDYKKLYSGLEEDIELKEIKLQQDARIFYFDVESERIFYVVAIRQNHLETNKVRR